MKYIKQEEINRIIKDFVEVTGRDRDTIEKIMVKALQDINQNVEPPTKKAELKHDLFKVEEQIIDFGYYSKNNLPKIGYSFILPKGTIFYYDSTGWYESVGCGICEVGEVFEKEHLTNIVDIEEK
jgi:hypothetical protein